eukprot:8939042-Pyramimonas_sp.AAC.1
MRRRWSGKNILFIQEHNPSHDYVGDVSAACLSRHLTVGLTESAAGPGGGRAAGVGFVAPRCLGLAYLDG